MLTCVDHLLCPDAQIDRSPHAAIFDALIFTVSQFCFNRSTPVRMVANFLPCFGWHFLKRTIPALSAARGHDVEHLLCAVAIYTTSIVTSCMLQPLIDARVKLSRLKPATDDYANLNHNAPRTPN
jgi:hypothetical protein